MKISAIHTHQHYDQLIKALGKKYFKTPIESQFDFISIANKGLEAQVILNFRNHFSISREVVASLLNISEPTAYRWIQQNKKLDRNTSILLMELTDLFLYGEDVFNSRDLFFKWLNLPNIAIGGIEPIELLSMPNGIAKVQNLLGRIAYGVYS